MQSFGVVHILDEAADVGLGLVERAVLPQVHLLAFEGAIARQRDTFLAAQRTGAANGSFVIRDYGNPSGADDEEGQVFLGQHTVTTDAQGQTRFSTLMQAVPIGSNVTATATSANGDTSEFSVSVQAGET